jgi:hypothetical protein
MEKTKGARRRKKKRLREMRVQMLKPWKKVGDKVKGESLQMFGLRG